MEPPAKRLRLSPPTEQRRLHESSSDEDDFYAPAPQPKQPTAPEETDYDDEVEILDEGEEVEEIDEADMHIRRAQSLNKIRSKWDEICAKYGREFENADEIDLNTLEVVVDNGHIAQMQDETDVGNGQPTRQREQQRTQHKQHDDVLWHAEKRRRVNSQSSPQRRTRRDHSSARLKSRSPEKANPSRSLAGGRQVATKAIYEDESSDDDFLYEKPAPSTVVLAPRQPHAINQIRPRGGSRTVVEKRTVITTKRITTSTIRDDRSKNTGPQDENNGRHMSHERNSREVQQYTRSSQEKVVETSSDDELVQRDHEPARALRSPSPTGKESLWAPRKKVGRPRIHHADGRRDRHARPARSSPRRIKRVVRYDADGNKIRKERSDRGIPRVPQHLRKTPFKNKYATESLASDGSMLDAPSVSQNPRPQLLPGCADAKPIPSLTSDLPKQQLPRPLLFARNTVDKSYDFSDEDDDALPINRPLLLTASSRDTFLGQNAASQLDESVQPRAHENPRSPPPPYREFAYDPTPLDIHNSRTGYENYAALVAPMATMLHVEEPHQFLLPDSEPAFMDTYLSFPPTSLQDLSEHRRGPDIGDDHKPLQPTQTVEPSHHASEDNVPIPIDPALLAFDAENRAASLERAQAASDPVDEPGMEGIVVPTLPFEELANSVKRTGGEEEDSDDDLFDRQSAPEAFFNEAVLESDDDDDLEDFLMPVQNHSTESEMPLADSSEEQGENDAVSLSGLDEIGPQSMIASGRTEVPDSDAESEDELLTQPSSQPPRLANLPSSHHSPYQPTPNTAAMKRVRFADTVMKKDVAISKVLPPPAWSPLTDEGEEALSQRCSSPSWQPQASDDGNDMTLEDDEDDLALLPDSPIRKPRALIRAVSAPSHMPTLPSHVAPRSTPPLHPISALPPQSTDPARNDENKQAAPKSILKRPSRPTTPQPTNTTSRSRSTSTSRATPPRLFSFSASPQPSSQSKPRPKLRASLLSESASTTPRRTSTPTPPPQPASAKSSSAYGRLLSASPAASTSPSGMRRSRSEVQSRLRAGPDRGGDEESEVAIPSVRYTSPANDIGAGRSKERSASAEMPEGGRRCGERGFRCRRTICFKCKG